MAGGRGRTSRRWREVVRPAAYRRDMARGAECWICRGGKGPIDYAASNDPRSPHYSPLAWEPDHIKDVATHPHLAEDLANIAPSHSCCNRRRTKKRSDGCSATESEGENNSRNWFE